MNCLKGRYFQQDDYNAKYESVIITKMMQEENFGNRPVIDSVYLLDGEKKIVGMVDHYKYMSEFREEDPLTFFLKPKESRDLPNLVLELAPGTPAAFEEEVNRTISEITRRNDFVIQDFDKQRVANSRGYWIPLVASLSICGFLIINVALGLFGVLYYTINKRRAEIGLRRTLGATKGEITFQFIAEVIMVAAIAILPSYLFRDSVAFAERIGYTRHQLLS